MEGMGHLKLEGRRTSTGLNSSEGGWGGRPFEKSPQNKGVSVGERKVELHAAADGGLRGGKRNPGRKSNQRGGFWAKDTKGIPANHEKESHKWVRRPRNEGINANTRAVGKEKQLGNSCGLKARNGT